MIFSTFLGCNKDHISRMHLVPGKVSFYLFSRSLLVSGFATGFLLPCPCSALQLLRSGCSQEGNKFPWVQSIPHHARNICQLRQASSNPSCTPFQQNRTYSKTEQTASKEIKQLYSPSPYPSLIPSPSSDIFEFPATVSYICLVCWKSDFEFFWAQILFSWESEQPFTQ